MPKKYRVDLTQHAKQSPASATQKTSTALSVNAKLEHLRQSQIASDSQAQKRILADISSQKSVPPSVGTLLGVIETAPLKPRPGARARPVRRLAGPPPPRSWLDVSRAESDRARHGANRRGLHEPDVRPLCRFLELTGQLRVRHGTLLHHALCAVAKNWDSIAEYESDYIYDLPSHALLALPGYMLAYGLGHKLRRHDIELLCMSFNVVDCLDLSALIGCSMSMKEVAAHLKRAPETPSESSAKIAQDVLDSWDEDLPTGFNSMTLHRPIQSIASTLTKLSLSHPANDVSWSDLLSLTAQTSALTHLSLACWPYPTRTPNMKRANTQYTTATGQRVAASASSMYATLDHEHTEAYFLLRRLSNNTPQLRWLDLEGCNEWFDVLCPPNVADMPANSVAHRITAHDDGTWAVPTRSATRGPAWATSWKRVSYLRLAQRVPLSDLPLAHDPNRIVFSSRPGSNHQAEWNLRQEMLTWLDEHKTRDENRSVSKAVKVCNACHNTLGSPQGQKSCSACIIAWNQAQTESLAWVEREVDARRVGRRCVVLRGPLAGWGPLEVDFAWTKL